MSDPLFNPNPDKIIDAFDLFGKKHKRNLKNFKFRVGAYGTLVVGGQILLQRHPKLNSYGLPGGGVEIGETIYKSLKREFIEETGLEIEVGELFMVIEDFFTYEDSDAHGILIVYKVINVGGQIRSNGNDDDTAEVKFIGLSELTVENTQRVFWPIINRLKQEGIANSK